MIRRHAVCTTPRLISKRRLALSTSALHGPRSSENSEMFTQAACLLLRREVLDALAEPIEPLGSVFARLAGAVPLEPVERSDVLQVLRWRWRIDSMGPPSRSRSSVSARLPAASACGRGVRHSMMLGIRNAARLPARQRKKYRSGWCQLMFGFRPDFAPPRAVIDRQRDPTTGPPTWRGQCEIAPRCRLPW